MDLVDILIALALALATIRLTFLGVQVNPKEKAVFYIIGAVILVLIGWQAYRSSESQHDLKTQLGAIEQNTKQPPTVQVTPQINVPPPQIIISPSEVERAQSDKQQKAAMIKKLCSHEVLHFREKPAVPPSPYNGNFGYATQIEVRPRFGSSATLKIRINADAVFQLYEKYPDTPEVVTLSGNGYLHNNSVYFHEFELKQGDIKNIPTTMTLLSNSSFNVICIDRIPPSFG